MISLPLPCARQRAVVLLDELPVLRRRLIGPRQEELIGRRVTERPPQIEFESAEALGQL